MPRTQFLEADPDEFESFASYFVSKMGFDVEEKIRLRDGSTYIIAKTTNPMGGKITSLVRAGAYPDEVDEPLIKELEQEMTLKGAIRGAFITSSDFTKEAMDYTRGKPISLINRFQIAESLEDRDVDLDKDVASFMRSHGLAEKRFMGEDHIFIPGRKKDDVLSYFESKKRSRRVLLGGVSEKIEEVETRYAPVCMFKVTKAMDVKPGEKSIGKIEKDDFLFVNLNNADLYYIKRKRASGSTGYVIDSTDNLRDIFDLPDEAFDQLTDLLDHGALPYKQLEGKYLTILESKDVITLNARSAGLIQRVTSDLTNVLILVIQEVLELVVMFAYSISGTEGGGSERHLPDTGVSGKESVVMASVNLPHLSGGVYDLKKFLVVRMVSGLKFRIDSLNYSSREVAGLLKSIFSAISVSSRGIIFMPYFVCTYRSQDVNALRRREVLITPKFISEEVGDRERAKKRLDRRVSSGMKFDSVPYKIIR